MFAQNDSRRAAVVLFRWSARLLSIASTVILLFFVFGEKFEASRVTGRQWLAFVFFPLGIVFGFAVGWWKEGLGGVISVLSLLIFYLIFLLLLRENLARGTWFLVFAIPGFLFLATDAISRAYRYPRGSRHPLYRGE
jgi:hypothetical protein